jgi:hypothetical protein
MLKIKIPFGYKTLQFDCISTMYTGKIRVKLEIENAHFLFGHIKNLCILEGRGGCVTISYMTSEFSTHLSNITEINAILCSIMHERIDIKYSNKRNSVVTYPYDEPCF